MTEPTTALVETGKRPVMLTPVAAPAAMIAAQSQARAFIAEVLTSGVDYGKIPGTDKATLLKPGAEKVTTGFGCKAIPSLATEEVDHDRIVEWTKRKKVWANEYKGDRSFTWAEEGGTSRGLYRFVVRVEIVDEHGEVRGAGLGSCSTMEGKYVDRPRESENTVLKMAVKRAHVAAVLSTFGLSEQFTQDMEDVDRGESPPPPPPIEEPAPPPTADTPINFGSWAGTDKRVADLSDQEVTWALARPKSGKARLPEDWRPVFEADRNRRIAADTATPEPEKETVPGEPGADDDIDSGKLPF
jgi:hypothetical protein